MTERTVNGRYHPAVHDAERRRSRRDHLAQPGDHGVVPVGLLDRWHQQLAAAVPPCGDRAPDVGDFDGDGREDVLFVAPGGAGDAVWYSTPTGIDARSVSVNGTYAIDRRADGPASAHVPGTDDVLFVSNGADYLWRGQADRHLPLHPGRLTR